jgi:hypothetical protein
MLGVVALGRTMDATFVLSEITLQLAVSIARLDTVGLGDRIRAGRRAERFRGRPDLPGYFRPLGQYHRARDKVARPMYDFTARLAAIAPPTPAEMALSRGCRGASRTPTPSSAR